MTWGMIWLITAFLTSVCIKKKQNPWNFNPVHWLRTPSLSITSWMFVLLDKHLHCLLVTIYLEELHTFWPIVAIGTPYTHVAHKVWTFFFLPIFYGAKQMLCISFTCVTGTHTVNIASCQNVISDVLKEEWMEGWVWRQTDSNIRGHGVDICQRQRHLLGTCLYSLKQSIMVLCFSIIWSLHSPDIWILFESSSIIFSSLSGVALLVSIIHFQLTLTYFTCCNC